MRFKAFRHLHPVEVDVFHAVGAVASLTIEMNMCIVVVAMAFLGAQFVIYDPSSILK